VILIEQQASVCSLSDYGPVEWYQSIYDAIHASTAAGRTVVEAAGMAMWIWTTRLWRCV